MKRVWKWLLAKATPTTIIVVGLLAFAFLPMKAFKEVTQELIALFGLMMAGVLPTMVLTASALRAGNLSVKKLIAYRDALRQQMLVWIGLFLACLLASLFVVIGKIIEWSALVEIPMNWAGWQDIRFDAVRILNALITMTVSLVLLRTVAVGNGIISLLRLSAELAISEAQAREEARHQAAEKAIEQMKERNGYGEYVDLKH